jgi:hypothetical protein
VFTRGHSTANIAIFAVLYPLYLRCYIRRRRRHPRQHDHTLTLTRRPHMHHPSPPSLADMYRARVWRTHAHARTHTHTCWARVRCTHACTQTHARARTNTNALHTDRARVQFHMVLQCFETNNAHALPLSTPLSHSQTCTGRGCGSTWSCKAPSSSCPGYSR